MSSPSAAMRSFQVWGSGTGVGKTLFSAGFAAHSRSLFPALRYLKPVQTGYPEDDDSWTVRRIAENNRQDLECEVLIKYKPAISPHRAWEHRPASDEEIVQLVGTELQSNRPTLVETAGGVLSPGPSGNIQADIYRPLRLPSVLVGGGHLGGISETLAAYESLYLRGYDVPFIYIFGTEQENHVAISKHVDATVYASKSPPPQPDPLHSYFSSPEVSASFEHIAEDLSNWMQERDDKLRKLSDEAKDSIWWPFTQHTTTKAVTVVDSAFEDDFTVAKSSSNDAVALTQQFDACSSWWTTGLGHGNAKLALEAARAGGRYGHIIFPEVVHEPAMKITNLLLEQVGKGWATRVFFSDNGSTAVEVGLKMILRKRAANLYGADNMFPWRDMKIIGFADSYHGDTLGVMDCSPKSVFNEKQIPWYEPRGIFVDAPTVLMKNKHWEVSKPDKLVQSGDENETPKAQWTVVEQLPSRNSLFDLDERLSTPLAEQYRKEIHEQILNGNVEQIGGLVMEPVLQGAGGMKLIDPLFQRILANECSKMGVPVLLDEVFSGLWRLGRPSAAMMLGIKPDVAVYAKLLTGGLLPLAVTLASEEVFKVFEGNTKDLALLHGHSYTAHPMGCQAACHALEEYKQRLEADSVDAYWSEDICTKLSSCSNVEGVVNIGTVLAVHINSGGQGYSSTGSVSIAHALRDRGVYARPLGNVVYLMCSPVTSREKCEELAAILLDILLQTELSAETA